MKRIETEKYYIRKIDEKDFEDVKTILLENEYLNRLWKLSLMSEESFDDFISNCYIKLEDECIIDKETGIFCGIISYREDSSEGELSVRMLDGMDLDEVMKLFAVILKNNDKKGRKNLTI